MLAVFEYDANNIRFENRDNQVWVSLTDMAKACGKLVADWQRLKSTIEFLKEFEGIMGIPIIESKVGGVGIPEQERGTWAIEEVALKFAAWCNVNFEIWVYHQIKELMSNGKVELSKQQTVNDLQKEVEAECSILTMCLAPANIRPELVSGLLLNHAASRIPTLSVRVNEAHKLLAATTPSELLLTPTAIGQRLGKSAIDVNKLLLNMGLQEKNPNKGKGDPAYIATEQGKQYSENTLATGKVGDDSTYQHLKWKESILEVLNGGESDAV